MSDNINKEILRGLEVISTQLEAIGKAVQRIALILTLFGTFFIVILIIGIIGPIISWLF